LEKLQRSNPYMASWLQTNMGMLMQVALFMVYIGIDAGKSLFAGKALKGTSVITTSLVITSSFISIIIGIVIARANDGMEGVRLAMDLGTARRYAPVACFFAVAQCFQALAYKELSPGEIKVIGQVRLLQTAALSVMFLGRRYIGPQWSAMGIVVLGAVMFFEGKVQGDEVHALMMMNHTVSLNRSWCFANLTQVDVNSGASTPWVIPGACLYNVFKDPTASEEKQMVLGLLYVAIYMVLSDLGSVVSEKFLKESSGTPFYVQKVSLELSGFPVSIAMSFILPFFQLWVANPDQTTKQGAKDYARIARAMWWTGTHLEKGSTIPVANSLFQGWGAAALLSLAFMCAGSWLSGIVAKRMNSVMKLLGKLMSLSTVYFVGDFWLLKTTHPCPPTNGIQGFLPQVGDCNTPPTICTVSQFVILMGTYTFVSIRVPPPEKEALEATREETELRQGGATA